MDYFEMFKFTDFYFMSKKRLNIFCVFHRSYEGLNDFWVNRPYKH